ncbi:MAG: 4-alpha-glucanotransferase [Clostridiales bacterium]|nr:4-alpha-glucanotransferase [Clostridiales bacterium]
MSTKLDMAKKRKRLSGILLHPTSLPGDYGIGDLGPEAYRFVDFLSESHQHIWQTLPLGPSGNHNSPYQCYSSFAGQPLLISPELLKKDGFLSEDDLMDVPNFPEDHVDYTQVKEYKGKLFQKAFENFYEKIANAADVRDWINIQETSTEDMFSDAGKIVPDKKDPEAPEATADTKQGSPDSADLIAEFLQFIQGTEWLPDYAMFMAIKKSKDGMHWLDWEKKYRKPTKSQKAVIARELEREIIYEEFLQWLFFRQWSALKEYANEHDILLIGDMPIFVSGDSADVWSQPKLFQLDKDGFPTVVAGVPPDYFSATGQLWGNPLYDWKYHKKTDFAWWMKRIETQLSLSDIVRIDHFRGLESYWEIPADAETALEGKWVEGPGDAFFEQIEKEFGTDLPIIAEDLGIITDEVRALRDRYELPGMKILQFAFEDDDSSYLPYNQPYNCICYTGTHDNDTSTGWYEHAPEYARDKVRRYMNTDGSQISWDFIRTCFGSPARIAIVPVQDLLCQGSEFRMNVPGVADGNWSYRLEKHMLTSDIATRLRDVTHLYGR